MRLSDAARRPVTSAPRIIDTAELPSSIRRAVLDAATAETATSAKETASAKETKAEPATGTSSASGPQASQDDQPTTIVKGARP